jgi:hypothetical protein
MAKLKKGPLKIKSISRESKVVSREIRVVLHHELPRTTMTRVYDEAWSVTIYRISGEFQSPIFHKACANGDEATQTYECWCGAFGLDYNER